MANSSTNLHSPFRKRVLIPLWVFQLGLAAFQFGWSLFLFLLAEIAGSDSGMTKYAKISACINMVLGAALTGIITTSIVKFARFRLGTRDYVRETILCVMISVVSIAFVFSAGNTFVGIFIAVLTGFSIGLMVYALVIKKRVSKGLLGEMRKPGKNGGGGKGFVNLEGGGRVPHA